MPLPNIHLNKGKYTQSGEEPLKVNTISDISKISQDFADKPKQSMNYSMKLQTAIPQLYHIYIYMCI